MNEIRFNKSCIGFKFINVLDIGVINDGKTDCSEIINEFLNNHENSDIILYIPKGKYYFKNTINIDGNFSKLFIEEGCICFGINPCIKYFGKLSDYDIISNLMAFYCYDTEGVDSGIKNEFLENRIRKIIEKMDNENNNSVDRLISLLLNTYFLNEKQFKQGYGIEDAKDFLDWFEMWRGFN